MDNTIDNTFESANRVYDANGIAPTVNTCGGGGLQPKIVEVQKLNDTKFVYGREADIERLYDAVKDEEQHLCKLNKMPQGELSSLDDAEVCDIDAPVASTITARYYKGIGNHKDNMIMQATKVGATESRNIEQQIVAMRGRNPDNPSDRTPGAHLEQRLEPQQEGICNTLTSVNKDNLVIERCKYIGNINPSGRGMGGEVTDTNGISRTLTVGKSEPNKILIKQATKTGYIECDVGGVADLSYPESKTRRGRGRVQNGGQVSPALTVSGVDGIRKVESPYRIRKLTPLECWRLMGFTDEDFHKAEAVNSNTQLYKQAGNSIVKNVLVAIMGQLFEGKEDVYRKV